MVTITPATPGSHLHVSVIVCTYRRAEALRTLLESLAAQTWRTFEVIVVDGSDDDALVRKGVDTFTRPGSGLQVKLIHAPKGLTRQRNVGLDVARGDIICFLDDDVTVEPTFVQQVRSLFRQPEMHDVGGITGYDVLNYPSPITWRWRARRWLRLVPSLEPGAADRLGRNVPLAFAPRSSTCIQVRWLAGFCMIYRRAAIAHLRFDEELPTYGGEDWMFSLAVGEQWRLLLCGSLLVQHHHSLTERESDVRRFFETGFGMGRSFAKRARSLWDAVSLVQYLCCEFMLDLMGAVARPTGLRVRMALARARGLVAGFRSVR